MGWFSPEFMHALCHNLAATTKISFDDHAGVASFMLTYAGCPSAWDALADR